MMNPPIFPPRPWKLQCLTGDRKAAGGPGALSAGCPTLTSWTCWLRRAEMDKRIFGIETEFGISYSSPDSRPLAPEEVARYLFRKVVSWGRSSNVFLTNGSRLYLDVGSHPEYATAECDDLAQLIAHDRAGERIIEGLVVDAQQRLREDGVAGDIYVFKNNTDSAGNSYGCHEN